MASFDEQIDYYKNGEKELKLISRFILERANLEKKISLLLADFTRNWNNAIPQGKIETPFAILKKFTEQSEFLKDQHKVFHMNLRKLGNDVLEMTRVNYPKNAFGNLSIPNTLIQQYEKVNY
jgi:hypothetical protein